MVSSSEQAIATPIPAFQKPTDGRYVARERPYADWKTEALIEYEHSLYDDEVSGEDTWSIRDQVLWELNWRNA